MKKVLFIFALTASVLLISTAKKPSTEVKSKLTEKLQEVSYSVTDCL